jgi:predicted ribosomally synthesized peptide with SipW-like signal peptide
MADDRIELTRRKILASAGAVGAAGLGAGLGTSALFSDTERFANNSLAAGNLDLRMDWEEHYSYPQVYDGFEDPTAGLDVQRSEPEDEQNYVGLPDPTDPVVWVHEDDFEEYFQNTTIEAFPDAEGDPVEADFESEQPCTMLANVPGDLGTYNDEDEPPARTRNQDTYDEESGEPKPLISLSDVKPGDYGEFTFSTHLCYNDGYLWLQMPGGLAEFENSLQDPESTIGNDSSGEEGELAENIETTLWYDDDCSNTIDGEPDPLISMALIDTSGSVDAQEMQKIADASNAFVETLDQVAETEVAAGVMTFSGEDPNPGGSGPEIVLQNDVETLEPGSAYLDGNGNGQFDPGNNLLPSEGSGQTPLTPALDLAREVLDDRAETLINTSGNGFGPNTRKTILVISDGEPTDPESDRYSLVDPGGTAISADNGNGQDVGPGDDFVSDIFDGLADNDPNSDESDEALLVARDVDEGNRVDDDQYGDAAAISGDDDITLRTVGVGTQNQSDLNDFLTQLASNAGLFYNTTFGSLAGVVNDIIEGLNVTGPAEEVIFRGTLEELAGELDPAQDGPMPLDGMNLEDDGFDETENEAGDPGHDCFNADATHCFGLAWWVQEDVGNEIQSDSVEFDLGFYAEQCRNNDEPGQNSSA